MGFKTTNYEANAYGITVPEAYARVTRINVDVAGKVDAMFEIQQSREDIGSKKAFELIPFRCEINKELPLHRQVYEKAKTEFFKDWKDDIVEPENE